MGVALVLMGAAALAAAVAVAAGGPARTIRVSVGSHGRQANNYSIEPAVSAHGGFVTFESAATNLVRHDTNRVADIYGRDLRTGTTARLSISSRGAQPNGMSHLASMSSNGRFVAYESVASNLVHGDTNRARDIFVRDRHTHHTRRVSVGVHGEQGDGDSANAFISPGGRYVSFESAASNLVPHDTNHARDVFVRDMRSGTTRRVSVSSSGAQAGGDSYDPVVSTDGRWVAFTSDAPDLVPHDTNGVSDVFVADMRTGAVERVTVSSRERQARGASLEAEISHNGRFVAFSSLAPNLVSGDTNNVGDIFVRDRRSGVTRRISVSSSGAQGNALSRRPGAELAQSRFVIYESQASNLVPGDRNKTSDEFVSDLVTGQTRRVTVNSRGVEANALNGEGRISADGRFAAFISVASNLVPHDTNSTFDIFVRGPHRRPR